MCSHFLLILFNLFTLSPYISLPLTLWSLPSSFFSQSFAPSLHPSPSRFLSDRGSRVLPQDCSSQRNHILFSTTSSSSSSRHHGDGASRQRPLPAQPQLSLSFSLFLFYLSLSPSSSLYLFFFIHLPFCFNFVFIFSFTFSFSPLYNDRSSHTISHMIVPCSALWISKKQIFLILFFHYILQK